MSDWIDGLADEVAKADEQGRQKQVQKGYVLHVSKVLGQRGVDLWGQLIESCQEAVGKLNDRIALRFPGDQSKQVVLEKLKPSSFSLSGKYPSFSMTVTYDLATYHVLLNGEKTYDGTREGRNGLILMELDNDGNPCFTDVDHHQVSVAGVVRYILELSMATSQPNRPVN
jgi:hypothetical protein